MNRRMCVTVDDLPQNSRIDDAEHRLALNEALVRTLAEADVPAVGFVNASKCFVDGEPLEHQRAILRAWLDAGFELGNHTWSHPDVDRVGLEAFLLDVDRGAVALRPILDEAGAGPLRWFRHPYLHRGRSEELRVGLETALRSRGYREAPVTIDNAEWVYAFAYEKARLAEDDAAAERIADDYVRYMVDMVRFWEDQSQHFFGRNVDHVLLVHANLLNADRLGELLRRIRDLGYRFVDLDTVLRDPAFASEDRFEACAGISWLHRWAITRGVDRAVFAGEPTVSPWVQEWADR